MLCMFPLNRYATHSQKNGKNFLEQTESKTFAFASKRFAHLESRDFLSSSSKDFKSLKRSGIETFDGTDPLFVQLRNLSSVSGDKSINK